MDPEHRYSINLDAKFGPLQPIDIAAFASQVAGDWVNQTLCRVNDSVVRVGVFQKGEFHWHKHDKEDEFFLVLSGKFRIEIEGQSVVLERHQGFTVPRGVLHKTSALGPATVLMVEAATVTPTGD
jgi:mannose-6-phosphate isomerase-like protein (cupin superfamily)